MVFSLFFSLSLDHRLASQALRRCLERDSNHATISRNDSASPSIKKKGDEIETVQRNAEESKKRARRT